MKHRMILQEIAERSMVEHGLLPAFSPEALAEVARLVGGPAGAAGADGADDVRDLQGLPWCSIDNDDSRDLDQLSVAETMPSQRVRLRVAVADVDVLVKKGSAIDEHARHNTTSVYTAAKIFPMLPEELSTDLTSLNLEAERRAVVIEMVIGPEGSLEDSSVYRARVRNHAKLAYNSVAAWLDGKGPMPAEIAAAQGVEAALRLQDRVAGRMKSFRHEHGALSLQTIEARPVFDGDAIRELTVEERNRAKDLIEDFMIAANGVTARFLESKGLPSIRRVVRTPKRWDRIVEIAAEHGVSLPSAPDAKALEGFLEKQRSADPLRFPDLSLSVIKLMGPGEYVAERPGETPPGHFGLAVKDYAHSTAPNRRYADLVTQRLLKAALAGQPLPYGREELDVLARRCTEEEDAVNKVERQVGKSAAALLLQSRIGESFDAIVTGASEKGTWVRLLTVPVEGRLAAGFEGIDVGDRLRVQLVSTNVERGFIDFKRTGKGR
jgi:ribonuclease R